MSVEDPSPSPTPHLIRTEASEACSSEQLLSAIHAELRQLAAHKMATERAGHTLQPTALVHEAWLRLQDQSFENRAHFFGAAGEAMRRILVDHARRRRAVKNGGQAERVNADAVEIMMPAPCDELIAVHEALDELAAHSPRKAELVKLRYFVGLSFDEAAALLGISVPTAKRDWTYARAWLHDAIARP